MLRPKAGLWQVFSYEGVVEDRVPEGGTTASTHRTERRNR